MLFQMDRYTKLDFTNAPNAAKTQSRFIFFNYLQKCFSLNLFRMDLFGAAKRWGGESKKSSLSFKSVTHILSWWNWRSNTLPKDDLKIYINHMTHPLNSADISIFRRKSATFAISLWRNADIDYFLIHNS